MAGAAKLFHRFTFSLFHFTLVAERLHFVAVIGEMKRRFHK